MKKGLLLALALSLLPVDFVMTTTKVNAMAEDVVTGFMPLTKHDFDELKTDLKSIHRASTELLEPVKNISTAFRNIESFIGLRTSSKILNHRFSLLKPAFTELKKNFESTDSSEEHTQKIIATILPLHEQVIELTNEVQEAGISDKGLHKMLSNAFMSLQTALNNLILQHALELHIKALTLKGAKQAETIEQALAILFSILASGHKHLQVARASQLILFAELVEMLPKTVRGKTLEELLKDKEFKLDEDEKEELAHILEEAEIS